MVTPAEDLKVKGNWIQNSQNSTTKQIHTSQPNLKDRMSTVFRLQLNHAPLNKLLHRMITYLISYCKHCRRCPIYVQHNMQIKWTLTDSIDVFSACFGFGYSTFPSKIFVIVVSTSLVRSKVTE